MLNLVIRRHFRRIVFLLVAAQVLLSAPVGSALASMAAAADSSHCAGMMPPGDHAESCPCCPDGETGTAACLSACMASAGAIAAFVLPRTHAAIVPAAPLPLVHRADLADPPLNPPPIA
jgi:hypothetical protein